MILEIDNRIVCLNGMVAERKSTGFSITIDDVGFPILNGSGQSAFGVRSKKPIRMTIEAGEDSFYFESVVPTSFVSGPIYGLSITSNGLYIPGFDNTTNTQIYETVMFSSQSAGTRVITFVFEDYGEIEELFFDRFNFYGAFPNEIIGAEKLRFLRVSNVNHLTSFPTDLSSLVNLREIRLSNLGLTYDKIPDSFFELDLTIFRAENVFNLADPISSNLFKVSFWKNLEYLELGGSYINDYFPEDLIENPEKVTNLRLNSNTWSDLPERLALFTNLRVLYWGTIVSTEPVEWFDTSNLKSLSLLIVRGNVRLDNLANDWEGLVSLETIQNIDTWEGVSADSSTIINSLYELVTNEASILPNGAAEPYPNRFRNMQYGRATFIFTGAKVAPDGYIQGVSNGTPTTPGQRIYVLQNQYGHTITHA